MKIAHIFFGQVKNFNDILYKSFVDNIQNSIKNYNIEYFLFTFNTKQYINSATKENHLINYESIIPYFTFKDQTILDTEANYTLDIDEFVNCTLSSIGFTSHWGKNAQESTIRSIRQQYCLYKIKKYFLNSDYNKYILCRPDCIFENRLDKNILTNNYNINIPNFNHWYGYNDRFAIVDKIGLNVYCGRYENIVSKPQIYHSESYLKYIIDNSGCKLNLFDNFRFRLLRSNGLLSSVNY